MYIFHCFSLNQYGTWDIYDLDQKMYKMSQNHNESRGKNPLKTKEWKQLTNI